VLDYGETNCVVEAIEKCNLDLQAQWNVGEERMAGFKSLAEPLKNLAHYLDSEDYPYQAVREHLDGAVHVALMIDEKGVLKDCVAEKTSGVASLDAQTCAVLVARAKFRPAINASGEPVRSVRTTPVRWALPN